MSLAFDTYLSDLEDFIREDELDLDLDMELEVYAAFGYAESLEHDDIEHWSDDAYHAYQGTFRTESDLAESLYEESTVSDFIKHYIDWDRMGRDLILSGGYTEQNNHYFRTNY